MRRFAWRMGRFGKSLEHGCPEPVLVAKSALPARSSPKIGRAGMARRDGARCGTPGPPRPPITKLLDSAGLPKSRKSATCRGLEHMRNRSLDDVLTTLRRESVLLGGRAYDVSSECGAAGPTSSLGSVLKSGVGVVQDFAPRCPLHALGWTKISATSVELREAPEPACGTHSLVHPGADFGAKVRTPLAADSGACTRCKHLGHAPRAHT